MEITIIQENGIDIAVVSSDIVKIHDIVSALDFISAIFYETGCDRVIVHESIFKPDFFDLGSGLAGDVLQKFSNYRVLLAVVGSFAYIDDPDFHAFMRESNSRGQVIFAADEKEAIERISQ